MVKVKKVENGIKMSFKLLDKA